MRPGSNHVAGLLLAPFLRGALFTCVSIILCSFSPAGENAAFRIAQEAHSHPRPWLACSATELSNLRAALANPDAPGHFAVTSRVARAEAALETAVVFPPRGGRHNQWYQCERCQLALKRRDDSHHECPSCGRIYSGAPYDDVLFGKRHYANLRAMTDLAWAWALTGRKPFADRAAEYLKGYAIRYRKYPFRGNTRYNLPYGWITGGRLFDQALEEAVVMVNYIAPAYDLVADAGCLDDQDHYNIRENLFRPVLHNIAGNFLNAGNWHCWQNAALFWGGVSLGEAQWIERALNDRRNGFYAQMRSFVTSDGMWSEGSWGYHFYALEAMVQLAEGARRCGLNLWDEPFLRAMARFPAACSMADGVLPRFGDDTGTSPARYPEIMEAAWNSCRDAVLIPFLPSKAVWQTVLYGRTPGPAGTNSAFSSSAVYPGTGYAILRSAGDYPLSAAITFGAHGGYHGHFDKLSFVLHGPDRELAVDPGRAFSQAYRLPIHRNWYRATISHNAVLVDGRSQRPARGRLEFFKDGGAYSLVSVRCDDAYPGVVHRRLMVLMPGCLLVADHIVARTEHRFDWLYHAPGTSVYHSAAGSTMGMTLSCDGSEFITGARGGNTDGSVMITFHDEGVLTRLTAAAATNTRVMTGKGPFRSINDTIPMATITRQGREVVFAVLLEPGREGVLSENTGIASQMHGSILTVNMNRAGRESVITWNTATGEAEWGVQKVRHP